MSTRAIQIEFLLSGLIHPTTYTPLTEGTVYFYAAGTTTAKNVWTEKEKTNAFTSYELATGGIKQLYGDGIYKIIVKDSSGTTVYTWDNIKIRAHNYSVVTKTANYTATADDDVILVNNTSGHVTISFPTAADLEYPITVIHITGSNNVVLDPYSTQTIDGDSTYTFSSTNSAVIVVSDGSNLRKGGNVALGLVSGATITLANTGLHILDSNASHDLIIKPGSNLTGDKTLTLTTGDADRTLSMGGNITTTAAVSITGAFIVSDATTLKAADIFPAGTIMFFGQASAPTGWTKKTDWEDGAMLVLNSDANGTALADGGAVKAQTAHTHTYNTVITHGHALDADATAGGGITQNVGSGAGGTDGSDDDAVVATGSASGTVAANTAFYYQEMIACTKD